MENFKYFLLWCFLMLIAAVGGTFINELMVDLTPSHPIRSAVFLGWIAFCTVLFIKLDMWWNNDKKNW